MSVGDALTVILLDMMNKKKMIVSSFILISTVCCPPGCHVNSFPCERKTLETVKELLGNFMCWKGAKGYSPYTALCPHYRQVGLVFFFFE